MNEIIKKRIEARAGVSLDTLVKRAEKLFSATKVDTHKNGEVK